MFLCLGVLRGVAVFLGCRAVAQWHSVGCGIGELLIAHSVAHRFEALRRCVCWLFVRFWGVVCGGLFLWACARLLAGGFSQVFPFRSL